MFPIATVNITQCFLKLLPQRATQCIIETVELKRYFAPKNGGKCGVVVLTVMVPDGGVAAVGERAGAPVAYSGGVVRVPAEYPRRDPAAKPKPFIVRNQRTPPQRTKERR